MVTVPDQVPALAAVRCPSNTPTQEPTVTIIIPTYNRASLIVETIQSALAQTYRKLEIVVVDDGSTDDTREVLRPYLDRIIYIYQENRGRSAARNVGISNSRGEYLVFLDSDDLLLPDKLARQISFLETHREVDLVYSDGYALYPDGRLGPLEPHITTFPPTDPVELAALFLKGNLFAPHTAMLRRRCLDSDAPFDVTITGLEDWELWLRLLLKGATFAYQDGKVAIYRRHEGNTDVVEPFTFIRARVATCAKIIRTDADCHLPARVRQDFRLQHLGAIARTRSPKLIGNALGTILRPEARPSIYGCTALATKIVVLPARFAVRKFGLALQAGVRAMYRSHRGRYLTGSESCKPGTVRGER